MGIPYDRKEIDQATKSEGMLGRIIKAYKYPVTPKEAYKSLFKGEPVWQMMGADEIRLFAPRVIPDNIARAMVIDATEYQMPPDHAMHADMFGIEWEYIAESYGSMVRPGKPTLLDANDWKGAIAFPDIDRWDWEGCALANAEYLKSDKFIQMWFQTGWFERLISWMDFDAAAFALIDEDQVDAVREIMFALSDLYIRIFGKCIEHFPGIDGFCIHDDWGGQKSCFFSPAAGESIIVPAMRKVTDFLHANGKYCDLHSCGQAIKQVPNMIKAGWDSWSGQPMNDTALEYEMYGDGIIIGVIPDPAPPGASEEELRAAAKKYVDAFCKKGKPSTLNPQSGALSEVFCDEVYKLSRMAYYSG